MQALKISHEAQQKLAQYQALLVKWQTAINLVAPKTIEDAAVRHFQDSLQIEDHIPSGSVVADLGSGGGFPGLVLAIARPDLEVHLIESDLRKCEFLRTVSRETGATAHIHNARVEDVLHEIAPDFITARAFAPLDKILTYCQQSAQKNPALKLLLLKGAGAELEIEEAQKSFHFDHEIFSSQTSPDGKILLITSLRSI